MIQPALPYASEFKRILNGFSHKRHIRELFTDWLEIAACAVHQEPYHMGFVLRDDAFEAVETQYLAAVKKYERPELDAFAKLLGLTKMALWEKKCDFLGQLYMELEISQNRSGEFFTPFPISLMTAKMLLSDVAELIQEKGHITVAEPTCGGGGMLIAAAQVIEAAGYDPGEVMFFEATDISKPCCNMAYIQTSILELSGIVRHGNSLSQETWSHRFTPICRVFPDRTRRFLDSLTPDATEPPHGATHDASQPTEDEPAALRGAQPGSTDVATDAPEPSTKPGTAPESGTDAEELIALAQMTERYVQGRLF